MEDQRKEFTGVWIPRHIIEDEDLSMTDKMIYAEIACFDTCYKSNEKLGDRYGLKADTISKSISRLVKKGYVISKGVKEGRYRELIAKRDMVNPTHPRRKILPTLGEKSYAGSEKNPTIEYNTDNNIENNNTIQRGEPLFSDSEFEKNIGKVIQAMCVIDPKNKLYYKRKDMRSACGFLLKEYGLELVLGVIAWYLHQKQNPPPYFPSVTTPCELRDKWVKLKELYKRVNAENKKLAEAMFFSM